MNKEIDSYVTNDEKRKMRKAELNMLLRRVHDELEELACGGVSAQNEGSVCRVQMKKEFGGNSSKMNSKVTKVLDYHFYY